MMAAPYRTAGTRDDRAEEAELRDFARRVGAGPRWLWTPGARRRLPEPALAVLAIAWLAPAVGCIQEHAFFPACVGAFWTVLTVAAMPSVQRLVARWRR